MPTAAKSPRRPEPVDGVEQARIGDAAPMRCPTCGRELRRTSDVLTAGGSPAPEDGGDGPRLWSCDSEGATFAEDGATLRPVGAALYGRGGATSEDHAVHAPGGDAPRQAGG